MTAARPPGREAALRKVRGVLERLMGEGTAVSRRDGSTHRLFPVAVSAAEGAAIRSWVIRENAVHTAEVGLGYAISALFACEGLLATGHAAPTHTAIDPHQGTRFAGCGLQFLADAGVLGLVKLHADESQLVLPRLLGEGRRFDAVFLDLAYLGRLLRPGGIVFLDDYQLPAIAKAAAFFVANRSWAVEQVSGADEHHHWAVLRTSTVPDTRPFDHFVDF